MTGWASESFKNTQALEYPKQRLWHFYKNSHPGMGCDRSALPVCITIWSSLCLCFILCVRFVSRCDDIAPCSCVSSERQPQLAAENIKQVYPHLNTPPVFANFGEKYYWANFFSSLENNSLLFGHFWQILYAIGNLPWWWCNTYILSITEIMGNLL